MTRRARRRGAAGYLVIASAVGAGCVQVLGLGSTSGPPADASAPGGGTGSIEIDRVSIGASVVVASEDVTKSGGSVVFLSPLATQASGYASVPGTQGPNNVWMSNSPLAPGSFADVRFGGQRHIFALTVSALKVTDAALEHPNPQEAPSNQQMSVVIGLVGGTVGSDTYSLELVGPWALESPLTTSGSNASQIVTFDQMTPLGTPPIAELEPSDEIVALGYHGARLDTAYAGSGFEPATGVNDVTGAMATVGTAIEFGATIDPTALRTRFAMIRPLVGTPSITWLVGADPGGKYDSSAGIQLNAGVVGPTDTTVATTFGNPFTALGWPLMLELDATETRTIANGVALVAGTRSLVASDGTTTMLKAPAALPLTIGLGAVGSAAAVPLTSDGATVAPPAQFVPVTVGLETTNVPVSLYKATVYEVGSDALQYVADVTSADPAQLLVPPDAFVAGKTYTIRVDCWAGSFPNAGQGDLTTFAAPFESAFNYSGTFEVSP